MNLTIEEQNTINQLIDFGPETINGIEMSGIEAALYDMALGAASMKLWNSVLLAKSILSKLNPKAAKEFFGYETSQQPAGISYVAPTKVGRNEPCPCGSNKKSKKCCK